MVNLMSNTLQTNFHSNALSSLSDYRGGERYLKMGGQKCTSRLIGCLHFGDKITCMLL